MTSIITLVISPLSTLGRNFGERYDSYRKENRNFENQQRDGGASQPLRHFLGRRRVSFRNHRPTVSLILGGASAPSLPLMENIMGNYIAHRKFKVRKQAAPIVFNYDAWRKEREGWDIIQKVRELELADKKESTKERAKVKAENQNIPERKGAINSKIVNAALKHLKRSFPIKTLTKRYHPCYISFLHREVRGVEAKLFSLSWCMIFAGEGLPDEVSLTSLPTHRRDSRAIARLAWAAIDTSQTPRNLVVAKTIAKIMLLNRAFAAKRAELLGLEIKPGLWISPDIFPYQNGEEIIPGKILSKNIKIVLD